MDSKRDRQRNIDLPRNIWTGDSARRDLRESEEICPECRGRGGHSETEDMLIRCCGKCEGKGYLDWIDKVTGPGKDYQNYTYYIGNSSDTISAAVKKGEEEEYKERIRLQVTGEFKFKPKDEI